MRHKHKEEVLISPVEKNDNNFVAIIIDVGSVVTERRVIYHTANEDVETFKDFVESVLNEFSVEEVKLENQNFLEKFLENGVVEGKDFDEDTGREWSTYEVEGVLVQCFNGFDWSTLEKKLADAEKTFKEYESGILEEHMEAVEERKNPYAYRGLNKNDF